MATKKRAPAKRAPRKKNAPVAPAALSDSAALLAPMPAAAANQAELEKKLTALLRRDAQEWLGKKGITSVGVGYKIKDGVQTDQLCIQFTVEKKVAPTALESEALTPLPKSFTDVDGTVIPVDVLERRYEPAVTLVPDAAPEALSPRQRRRRRMNPVQPGASIAHRNETAGTLGAVVFDEDSGEPLLLSNWHVLSGAEAHAGDIILQPGPADGGDPFTSRIGTLFRDHLGLAGDCAVARIEGRRFRRDIIETGVTPERVGRVNLGDKVVKSGRTTGVTHGVVRRVGVVVNMSYPGVGSTQIGGFEIGPNPARPAADGEISMGGDSGSLWMVDGEDMKDVAVGLHFAGETDPDPAAEHALACNIHSVLEKLHVKLKRTGSAPQGLEAAEHGASAPTAVPGDLPVLDTKALGELQSRFDNDPEGTVAAMRRVFDSDMTEDGLAHALDRARVVLASGGIARAQRIESMALESAPEAARSFTAFPIFDPAIPVDPENHKFEDAGDLLRWIVFGGSGLLGGALGEKAPFRSHTGSASRFEYPLSEPAAADPVKVMLFSDFGTGVYHSLYIAKQIREAKAPYAFHLGDVYYAGRKDEFEEQFNKPLTPMLGDTELFMLNSNHEMYSGGKWYFDFVDRKRGLQPARQRQEGSYFATRNSKFQIVGIDTDWHQQSRYTVRDLQDWLATKLAEGRSNGLVNILLSANQPYEYGARGTTGLWDDIGSIVRGNVDAWFWGNNHYCALFDSTQEFPFVGSCIGHGGYPYGRQRRRNWDLVPTPFLETSARFPKDSGLRQDRGNNGFCEMSLNADGTIGLVYKDWMSNVRCTATLSRGADGRMSATAEPKD